MNVRIRKLKSGCYSVGWQVGDVKHSARRPTLKAAAGLRMALVHTAATQTATPAAGAIQPGTWAELGRKGGTSRAARQTGDERRALASHAARVRWGKAAS